MKYIAALIISLLIMLGGCSDDSSSESELVNTEFDSVVDKILGYHIEGQENTWMKQNLPLVNIYEDAIVFKDNDSIDVAYIGFAYGHDDLSAYSITKANNASYKINGTTITIRLDNGTYEDWRIVNTDDGFITFEQESTKEIFSMKIMN